MTQHQKMTEAVELAMTWHKMTKAVELAMTWRDAEDIADSLIDKGAVIPVRCKNCTYCHQNRYTRELVCGAMTNPNYVRPDGYCDIGKEREATT